MKYQIQRLSIHAGRIALQHGLDSTPCREVLDKTIIPKNGDKCSQLLELPAM